MAELEGDRLAQRQRTPHYDIEESRGVGTNGAYLRANYGNFYIRDWQFLSGIGRASDHGPANSEGNPGDEMRYQYDSQHCDADGHARFDSALAAHGHILRRAPAGEWSQARDLHAMCALTHISHVRTIYNSEGLIADGIIQRLAKRKRVRRQMVSRRNLLKQTVLAHGLSLV